VALATEAKPSSVPRDAVIGNGVRVLRMTQYSFVYIRCLCHYPQRNVCIMLEVSEQYSGIAGDSNLLFLFKQDLAAIGFEDGVMI